MTGTFQSPVYAQAAAPGTPVSGGLRPDQVVPRPSAGLLGNIEGNSKGKTTRYLSLKAFQARFDTELSTSWGLDAQTRMLAVPGQRASASAEKGEFDASPPLSPSRLCV